MENGGWVTITANQIAADSLDWLGLWDQWYSAKDAQRGNAKR